MEIKLTKHIFGDLEISDSNILGIYGPQQIEGNALTDHEISRVLAEPIGTEPLHRLAKGCSNVLIVTDDNTRSTPLSHVLPPILNELEAAGVPANGIMFLVGLGTHRPMTPSEIRFKFGPVIAQDYIIMNHSWNDATTLTSLGKCEFGFEVVINKRVLESDLIMSVGSIVPHATAGFSGGGKAIVPGICGEKTIEATHWTALNYSMDQILGVVDNPIRNAINSICRQINLAMIVNTILFDGDKVYGVAAGDLEQAFARGVKTSREVYGVKVNGKADIVIAEAYPTDIDLRQAIKAICSADLVCRDAGVIILPAECPEGVAPQFPEFVQYGFKNPDQLYHDVESGLFKDKLMAYTLVAIGRIISKRVRCIFVSSNIDPSLIEHMGFVWASDLVDAYDKACRIVGDGSKAIVLKQAGELLPLLTNEDD